jgi:hypothetical protein
MIRADVLNKKSTNIKHIDITVFWHLMCCNFVQDQVTNILEKHTAPYKQVYYQLIAPIFDLKISW